jgi:hypothetical protein
MPPCFWMISIIDSGEITSSLFMFSVSFSISFLKKLTKTSISLFSYFFASSSACFKTKSDKLRLAMSMAVSGKLWASSTINMIFCSCELKFLRNAVRITGSKTYR